MRASIAGLGITSIKWRCKSRRPAFAPGDPVWAETYAFYTESSDEGVRARFPATVINFGGAKALVFIASGALSDGKDQYEFEAQSNGFCNLPLSRLTPRDGERDEVCRHCQRPASQGHAVDYPCTPSAYVEGQH